MSIMPDLRYQIDISGLPSYPDLNISQTFDPPIYGYMSRYSQLNQVLRTKEAGTLIRGHPHMPEAANLYQHFACPRYGIGFITVNQFICRSVHQCFHEISFPFESITVLEHSHGRCRAALFSGPATIQGNGLSGYVVRGTRGQKNCQTI